MYALMRLLKKMEKS